VYVCMCANMRAYLCVRLESAYVIFSNLRDERE